LKHPAARAMPKDSLLTPIYLKLNPDMAWPDDKAFYLLTGDGLFFCRNHPFFRSSVPARNFPSELARHEEFLRLRHPRIPQELMETVIGYFARIAELHGAEAAVVLACDLQTRAVQVVVPEQVSYVSRGYRGQVYPIEVHYQIPSLPSGLMLMGDIHSHVNGPAYASALDRHDERHRAGLHIVVGRIQEEPPELHVEYGVDGTRFPVANPELFIEGYERRRTQVPEEWMAKLKVRPWKSHEHRPNNSTTLLTP